MADSTAPMAPDTKDWTWVLQRACPECGFDASRCQPGEVAGLVRATAGAWGRCFDHGRIRAGRTSPVVWSSLEYACHVRDVFVRNQARIELMCSEDDPLFANWDQDASAMADGYDEQDPQTVAADLAMAAAALADRLDRLAPDQWGRPGHRSDGATFTIGSLGRYMVHDPIHHLWDVSGRGLGWSAVARQVGRRPEWWG